jgi:Fe-S-cluster containining protein
MHINFPTDISFHCTKCGLCCGNTPTRNRHILLLELDAQNISLNTNRNVKTFTMHTLQKAPYVYEMKKNLKTGKCVFNKNDKCTIYDSRPLICRFYPFELTTNTAGDFTIRATCECPAISHIEHNKIKKLDKEYFQELVKLAIQKLQPASSVEDQI